MVKSRRFIFILALAVSFCSMAYELVIAKTFVFLTDEIILWESLSIGLFIASIGGGLFLASRMEWADSFREKFWTVEKTLALSGLLSVPLILAVHTFYRIYLADYQEQSEGMSSLEWVMLACQGINVWIGVLSGLEMSLLFEAAGEGNDATVIAFYNFGALLAALVFALLPHAGVDSSLLIFFASLLNAGIAWGSLSKGSLSKGSLSKGFGRKSAGKDGRFFFAILYVACLPLGALIARVHVKNYYFNPITLSLRGDSIVQTGPLPLSRLSELWHMPKIQRETSPYQVIDVVPESEETGEFQLFLNGHFQFSTRLERFYHEIMAHVPSIVLGESRPPLPKRFLVLGGGDGLLVRELLKYGEAVQSIDLVEIDPRMIALGKSLQFAQRNDSALSHPNVNIFVEDAFTWLRRQETLYDAIYLDFPYPFTFDGLRIYSIEFFKLLSRRFRPGGFLVMDIPLQEGSEKTLPAMLKLAGFRKFMGMSCRGETFLLATRDDRPFFQTFRNPGVTLEALEAQWFESPGSLFEIKADNFSQRLSLNSALKPRKLAHGDGWK